MADRNKITNRKDFLLLLLYAKGKTDSFNESIIGRTRVVKMMFLFMKEVLRHFKKDTHVNEDNFYQFFPWHFGPFSQDIYDDITFFDFVGFLDIENSQDQRISESYNEWKMWMDEITLDETTNIGDIPFFAINSPYEEKFKLTEKGEKYTESLYETLTSNQKELLNSFKLKLVSAPLRGILSYVYKRYPDMTTKSEIKQRF